MRELTVGKTLFEIGDELREIHAELADSQGEIDIDGKIDKWLQQAESDLNTKVNNYGNLYHELMRRAEVQDAEAKRFAALCKANRGNANRLADRLKAFMELNGLKRIDADLHPVAIRNAGGMLPLEITAEVPADFQITKTVTEVDKGGIREALEQGADLPFAKLGDRKTTIKIG
jgi:hypothetical protein